MRSSSLVAIVAVVAAFGACDDSGNDNPGYTPPCMVECGDGGETPDAGPPGPALFVLSTEPGSEAVQWLDLSGKPDAGGTIPFKAVRDAGLPGTPVGLAVDLQRTTVAVSLTAPAGLYVFDVTANFSGQRSSFAVDAGLASGDQLGPLTLASDRTTFYVASSTAQALYKVRFASHTVAAQVSSATVPELVKPAWVSLSGARDLFVGSPDDTVDRFQVFRDLSIRIPDAGASDAGTSGLSYQAAASQQLLDGADAGTAPGRCVPVPGSGDLYCVVAHGNPSGGVWRLSSSAAPRLLVTGLTAPGAAAVSPLGEKLYVADGASVRVYWIAGALAAAPAFIGSVAAPGPVSDLAASPDGQWVFASAPTANALLKIRALDLSVVETRSDLSRPGALLVVP